MRILDRYIRSIIIQNTLLVTLMLAALFSFLEILDQLSDLDKGNYSIGAATSYVLLTLPRRITDLMPIIAMLGAAFALNTLARSSELIAMRASGVSIARIGLAVFKTGLVLMILVALLDQSIAPPLEQYALRERNAALAGETQTGFQNGAGYWTQKDHRFVHVRGMSHGKVPTDLDIFEFNQQGALKRFLHAAAADPAGPDKPDLWLLQDVNSKTIEDGKLSYQHFASLQYPRLLRSQDLELLESPAQSLSTSALYEYTTHLDSQNTPSYLYDLSLWRKLARPLATGAMVLVAIPFGFGSSRSSSGKRITIASLAGLLLYLGNEMSGNAGMVFKVDPILLTLTPVLIMLLTAMLLMRRSGD